MASSQYVSIAQQLCLCMQGVLFVCLRPGFESVCVMLKYQQQAKLDCLSCHFCLPWKDSQSLMGKFWCLNFDVYYWDHHLFWSTLLMLCKVAIKQADRWVSNGHEANTYLLTICRWLLVDVRLVTKRMLYQNSLLMFAAMQITDNHRNLLATKAITRRFSECYSSDCQQHSEMSETSPQLVAEYTNYV